jgi:hypothetical protein
MIAFLILALALWLIWRHVTRAPLTITPPASTPITINVYVKEVNVAVRRVAPTLEQIKTPPAT